MKIISTGLNILDFFVINKRINYLLLECRRGIEGAKSPDKEFNIFKFNELKSEFLRFRIRDNQKAVN